MVSDKMANEVPYQYSIRPKHPNDEDLERVMIAQAVVNAAWTEFNPDDESTWPEFHKGYLVMCEDGDLLQSHWRGETQSIATYQMLYVTHYADPQDLMFKGE